MSNLFVLNWLFKLLLLCIIVPGNFSDETEMQCFQTAVFDEPGFFNEKEYLGMVGLKHIGNNAWGLFAVFKKKVLFGEIPGLVINHLSIHNVRLFIMDIKRFSVVYRISDSDLLNIIYFNIVEDYNDIKITSAIRRLKFNTTLLKISNSKFGLIDVRDCSVLDSGKIIDCGECFNQNINEGNYCIYDRGLDKFNQLKFYFNNLVTSAYYCNYVTDGDEFGAGTISYLIHLTHLQEYNEAVCFKSRRTIYKQIHVFDVTWPIEGTSCRDLIIENFKQNKTQKNWFYNKGNISYLSNSERRKVRVIKLSKCLRTPLFMGINFANIGMFFSIIIVILFAQLGSQRKTRLIGEKRRKWYNRRLRQWPKKKPKSSEKSKSSSAYTVTSRSNVTTNSDLSGMPSDLKP